MVNVNEIDGKGGFTAMFIFEGRVCGEIRVENVLNMCSIHFKVTKFTHNIFKEMKRDMTEVILPLIKQFGYTVLAASYVGEKGADKWAKFISKFGFPKPEVHYLSKMEV